MEKEELEQRLEEIDNYNEITKLYRDAKYSLKKEKITEQDYNYMEQQLKEKFFGTEKFEEYSASVLLKQVCPYIEKIEEFNIENVCLTKIGETVEEKRELIDVICTYKGVFINMFGIDKLDFSKSKKYEFKKYMKQTFFEAVKAKSNKNEDVIIHQFGPYFILEENDRLCIYKEKQTLALVTVEETTFDKVKVKLLNFFNKNIFNKNKYLPNLIEIYNTNKLKDFKIEIQKSKNEAKNRMRNVLTGDRIRVKVEE